MNFTLLRRIPAFALLLIASTISVNSQVSTGSLKGTVTDQLGALVVGATIVIKDGKSSQRTVTSDDNGKFEVRALAPGRYDVTITSAGFSTLEQRNVELRAGKTTTLNPQLAIGMLEQTVIVDNQGISTDADRNADAIVLRERELAALPDDPEALAAALQAMAGPGSMEGGGAQVKVDGFSNGLMPPKETIREVRVNQNPYSAENEYPGWGGIEIFTQPGADKFHGSGNFNFTDESLNSRNPFARVRAPYQLRQFGGNLTGPLIKKRDSFAFYISRNTNFNNQIINATVLDPITLTPFLFNQTIVVPGESLNFGFRNDLKVNKKHTLVTNYSYGRGSTDPAGLGGYSLPTRAFRTSNSYHQLQITETALINEKTINETRIQLGRSVFRQTTKNDLPALFVSESFSGGGSQVGSASNTQERAEVQNFTSWTAGRHFLKVGGRLRYVRIKSVSPFNFVGSYTFSGGTGPTLDANDQLVPGAGLIQLTSLERYRRTLLFQRQNLSPTQIRLLGGGATQFSINGGNPEAQVTQSDASFYFQDEWKIRPNLTLSPGLRYENQNNIDSNFNLAPRLGFAWSTFIGRRKSPPPAAKITETKAETTIAKAETTKADTATTKAETTTAKADTGTAKAETTTAKAETTSTKAETTTAKVEATPAKAPAGPPPTNTVIRGGLGLFYNRINENTILQTIRFNGVNQQQFVVTDPTVLDLFPIIPPVPALNAFSVPQSRRVLDSDVAPDLIFRANIGIEHQLFKTLSFQIGYSHSETRRNQRTLNINAPLGGTYNPAFPTSGIRPMGQAAGNVFEFQSNGRSSSDSIYISANGKILKKVDFWANYSWNKNRSSDSGTTGSPFDAYDFSQEWGRGSWDIRHWFTAGANYQTKSGFSVNTFIIANSGQPFNITTGRDTNGDTSFSERPAFATDLNKPGVVMTPYGALDPNPTPGQKIIPRNFAQGPSFLSVNFGGSKTFKFGRAIPPKMPPSAASGNAPTVSATAPPPAAGAQATPAKPPVQRPYTLVFSVYVTNALNHTNRGNPVGNMTSPFFLRSTNTSGLFFFGPGGGGAGGNRQVMMRMRLSF
jgi:carboxypeptidase family protein/TonB-dependent receptor-like protein